MLPNKVVKEHQRGQKPVWPIGKPALLPAKNVDVGNSKHGQVGTETVRKAQGRAFSGMR